MKFSRRACPCCGALKTVLRLHQADPKLVLLVLIRPHLAHSNRRYFTRQGGYVPQVNRLFTCPQPTIGRAGGRATAPRQSTSKTRNVTITRCTSIVLRCCRLRQHRPPGVLLRQSGIHTPKTHGRDTGQIRASGARPFGGLLAVCLQTVERPKRCRLWAWPGDGATLIPHCSGTLLALIPSSVLPQCSAPLFRLALGSWPR